MPSRLPFSPPFLGPSKTGSSFYFTSKCQFFQIDGKGCPVIILCLAAGGMTNEAAYYFRRVSCLPEACYQRHPERVETDTFPFFCLDADGGKEIAETRRDLDGCPLILFRQCRKDVPFRQPVCREKIRLELLGVSDDHPFPFCFLFRFCVVRLIHTKDMQRR